ncbi:TlpA disulfide reductase family protein [Shewanella donghaensis]|uniref:TlpA disulfide reductase family protein n=1 Tax=Shewanella donghaensis TaxID=238836 RepID=UPI00118328AA|nr:TlpA disulfide reductase family protein [Shewanella donghaensis]
MSLLRFLKCIGLSLSLLCNAYAAPNLDYDLKDLSGNVVNLNEFKGKVVYIDFWASWCAPCRKSFPWMEKMHQQYKQQGLVVIAINIDVEQAMAEEFLTHLTANFSIRFDPDSDVARAFELKGMPSSFVFDRQGNLVNEHVGFSVELESAYEQELVRLLNQKSIDSIVK